MCSSNLTLHVVNFGSKVRVKRSEGLLGVEKVRGRKYTVGVLMLALVGILGACNVSGGDESGNAPPGLPQYVTLTVEDPNAMGYVVAYQVGSGSWMRFNPNPYHVYTIQLQGQDRYGVAVYCNSDEIHLIHATGTELPTSKVLCGYPSSRGDYGLFALYLNLTQTGARTGDTVVVWSRLSISDQVIGEPSSVSVRFASYLEPQDLLVIVVRGDWPATSNTEVLSAEVLRDINIVDNGFRVQALGAPLVTHGVTINDVPLGFDLIPYIGSGVMYMSKNNRDWGAVGFARGGNIFNYREVRGLEQGDRYVLVLHYADSTQRSFISVWKGFAGGDVTVNVPMPWPPSSLSVTAGAHPSISGLNRTDSTLKGYLLTLTSPDGFRYHVVASKRWLASATTYTFPDLHALLGYTPFGTDTDISVSVVALLSSGPLSGVTKWPFLEHTSITSVSETYLVGAGGSYSVGQRGAQFP